MAILKTQITTGHPIPAINPCDIPDKKLLARYSVTSIQQRIKQYADNNKRKNQPTNLKLFATASTQNRKRIPCKLEDYFELVDWTGRISRNDKRGKIPNHCPAILQRLRLDPGKWLKHMEGQRSQSSIALGALHRLQCYVENCGFKWLCGQGYNRGLFGM